MCAKYNVNTGAALAESTDPISDCQVVREIMTNEAGSEEVSFKDANDKERSFLILPEGKKAVSIKHLTEEYRTQPERRTGTAKFSDLDSFCLHVNRFKGANSVIFASDNLENPSLTCVLDYHEQGDNEFEGTHFGQHRSLYQFPLSEEWKAWAKADSAGYLDHATFAEFLEDRIDDVLEPLGPEQADEPESTKALRKRIAILGGSMGTPQRIMELSRGLKVNQNASTTSAKTSPVGRCRSRSKLKTLMKMGHLSSCRPCSSWLCRYFRMALCIRCLSSCVTACAARLSPGRSSVLTHAKSLKMHSKRPWQQPHPTLNCQR